ncbi:MAG TPA: hypothetical protein ENK25_07010 [Bacteroidetes bacterium]|nr:hypothetical protein [Bacteroidota bacterium]
MGKIPTILLFLLSLTACKPAENDPVLTQIVIDKNDLSNFKYFNLENSIIFPFDFTLNEYTDSFLLDVDNNEVIDFIFKFSYFRNHKSYLVNLSLSPQNKNQVATGNKRTFTGLFPALPLSEKDTVDNRLTWQNEPVLMYEATADESFPVIGLCYNQPDKFLGIKFNNHSKDHFGWIEFSSVNHYLEIKSWAISRYQAIWW